MVLWNIFARLKENESLIKKVSTLEQENLELKNQLQIVANEELFNNKYPKNDVFYNRIETDGVFSVDVRTFLKYKSALIPIVEGETDDQKALNALLWVIKNIVYTPDNSELTYKTGEYWAYSYQTLKHLRGDCEDGAILLYEIMRKSGIRAWKMRLSAGYVKQGNKKIGHAYLTYYVEKLDKWVILDWCFFPNELPVEARNEYKAEAYYLDTWFSFNEDYSWVKDVKDLKKFEKEVNSKTGYGLHRSRRK